MKTFKTHMTEASDTPTIKIVEGIPKFIEWYLTYN